MIHKTLRRNALALASFAALGFAASSVAAPLSKPAYRDAVSGALVHADLVASGETYLQCQIRDANPDYSKIKLEAIMPDKTVRALEPLEEAPGLFRVSDAKILQSVVRATTLDKAGNRAVREVNLNPSAAPAL